MAADRSDRHRADVFGEHTMAADLDHVENAVWLRDSGTLREDGTLDHSPVRVDLLYPPGEAA